MDELTVLDADREPLDVLDVYNSLIWTERYCGYGDFEIYTPMNSFTYNLLKEDNFIHIAGSDNLMIVEKRILEANSEQGDTLIVTGRSLESILDRRIIWSQTLLSGDFQTEMFILFYQNVLSASDPSRIMPEVILELSEDPAIMALTIDKQETGKNLYDTIYDVCKVNHLGFKMHLTENKLFRFSFYYGEDRTYSQIINPWVIFSKEYDNLVTSDHTSDKQGLKTVSLILGAGEGNLRKASIAIASGGAGSGLTRREMFTDGSSLPEKDEDGVIIPEADYLAQLTEKGKEELAKNIFINMFEGQVDPTGVFIFGRDFGLGDIVQIENEYGDKSTARVTEIIRSKSPSGSLMYPTFTTVE